MSYNYGVSVPIRDADPTFLSLIAKAGFRNIEITVSGDTDFAENRYPDFLPVAADSAGIRLISLHSTGWNNCTAEKKEREASVNAAKKSIRLAALLGIPTVIVHPSAPSAATPFTEKNYDSNRLRAIQSLTELAEEGAKAEVRLAVENLPARHTARPGACMDDLLNMITGLGEHVGICHDAGHSNANRQNAAEEAKMAGSQIFAMHLQDNDGRGEDQHLLPEKGTTDWHTLIRMLNKIKYTKGRIIEVGIDKTTPLPFLLNMYDICRQWQLKL